MEFLKKQNKQTKNQARTREAKIEKEKSVSTDFIRSPQKVANISPKRSPPKNIIVKDSPNERKISSPIDHKQFNKFYEVPHHFDAKKNQRNRISENQIQRKQQSDETKYEEKNVKKPVNSAVKPAEKNSPGKEVKKSKSGSDPLILDAIKKLIDDKKPILIRNAIATLKLRFSEACEYDDFYRIDYDKYAKQIIDDPSSFMSPERKEEIRTKFYKPSQITNDQIELPNLVEENIKYYTKIANPEPDDKSTPDPIYLQPSDPNLVSNKTGQFNELIQNPTVWRKTILCTVCKQQIEDNFIIYISGYPYHYNCIKCMNCQKTYDPSQESLNNYICVTPGLFLCRQHYEDYQKSNHLSPEIFKEYHKKTKKIS